MRQNKKGSIVSDPDRKSEETIGDSNAQLRNSAC